MGKMLAKHWQNVGKDFLVQRGTAWFSVVQNQNRIRIESE
jgi:hypothetical protein